MGFIVLSLIVSEFGDDYPEATPQHEILKNSSPLTFLLRETNRRGQHRGYGDILKSLQSMQKLNVRTYLRKFINLTQVLDVPTSND